MPWEQRRVEQGLPESRPAELAGYAWRNACGRERRFPIRASQVRMLPGAPGERAGQRFVVTMGVQNGDSAWRHSCCELSATEVSSSSRSDGAVTTLAEARASSGSRAG